MLVSKAKGVPEEEWQRCWADVFKFIEPFHLTSIVQAVLIPYRGPVPTRVGAAVEGAILLVHLNHHFAAGSSSATLEVKDAAPLRQFLQHLFGVAGLRFSGWIMNTA